MPLPVTINNLSSRFAARLQFCMSMVGYNTGQQSGGRKGTIPAKEREGIEKVLLAEDGTFRVIRNHYGGADVWKFLLSRLQPPGSEMVDIK